MDARDCDRGPLQDESLAMGDMVNQEQVVGDSLNLRGRKWPLAGQGMQRPTERNRSRCRRNVYPEHAIALAVDATYKNDDNR